MTTLNVQAARLQDRFSTKLALAAIIAALGDRLFYDHPPGISIALFLIALATGARLTRPHSHERRTLWISAILLALALLPLFEATGFLSILFGVLGTALTAVIVTGGLSKGWGTLADSTQRLLLTGPFQLFHDLLRSNREAGAQGRQWLRLNGLAGWVVPILYGAIFMALFASANPLIEQWLTVFDMRRIWELDVSRMFMWIVLLAIAWPYLSVRLYVRSPIRMDPLRGPPAIDSGNRFFGSATILRSLVLFNLLFAAQTILDAIYLWGGVTLPEGTTYATYAQRGAYPLIVTALLAAGFVLAAMRPGGAGDRSPLIRRLVYLWIGQNILLVISSILRLDLYVNVYSLTRLRVAAFLWMLLVAVGLVLIVARIALGRSNRWLIGANVLALALILYACSFVTFEAVIANHNLSLRREAMPTAIPLDLTYVQRLGPYVIPAVDRYIARRGLGASDCLVRWRNHTARAHAARMEDWRAWTFRNWRLQHYLDSRLAAKEAGSATSQIQEPVGERRGVSDPCRR